MSDNISCITISKVWLEKERTVNDDDYIAVNATYFSLTLRNPSTLDSGNCRCASDTDNKKC